MSEPTGMELAEERDAEKRAFEGDMDAEHEADKEEDDRVVRWHGQPGVDYREISVLDWKKAGVDLENDVDGNEREVPVSTIRWDASNDFAVPLSALDFLSQAQIEQYIERDGRFRIEER